jgi:hypothetical protein
MAKLKGHLQQQVGAGGTKDKTKVHQQQQAGAGATKDKTKSKQQQQADIVSSSEALPSQVDKSPKRKEPRDRSSPIAESPVKKIRKATVTNPDELAAVEELEETDPPTTTETAPPTIDPPTTTETAPPTIDPATTTETDPPTTVAPSRSSRQRKGEDAAGVTSNSSGKGKDAADDNSDSSGIQLPASPRSRRPRKGKNAAGVNSDNAGKGKDEAGDISDSSVKGKDAAGDSSARDDSDSDITPPTPVKKPSGIERVQRGRKIKASSPAGRNIPSVPVLIFCLYF